MGTGRGGSTTKNHWRGRLAHILSHKTSPVPDGYISVCPVLKSVKVREHLGYWSHWQAQAVKWHFWWSWRSSHPWWPALVVSTLTAARPWVSRPLLLSPPLPPPLSPDLLRYSSLLTLPDHAPLPIPRHAVWPRLLCPFSCTRDSPMSKFNPQIQDKITCCLCKLTFPLSLSNQLVEESRGSSRQPARPEAVRRRRWSLQVSVLWNPTCRKQRLPSSSSGTLPRLPSHWSHLN